MTEEISVLIVDDVHILRKIIRDVLVKSCKISSDNIKEAVDGITAIREYKRQKPDIVFLDVLMPEQDGFETVRQIIEIDPNAYIIMCSSAGERSVVSECINLGAVDYVLKPIDPDRLERSIETYRHRQLLA